MSYLFELDPKAEAASALISDVGSQLQEAVLCERAKRKLTLQEIANRLDIGRAQVHRMLSGHSNLTLRSLAEIVYALDYTVTINIEPKTNERDCNFFEPHEFRTILGKTPPSQSLSQVIYEFDDA
ncbi:helix-turn-helix domain-containing protein [Phyllobacterium sp. 21LDTY02-6]|jgi:transcriptional regulator with XRE-family HTH domain|uniref:helix-turn-helix domain-containing protein n=1 Tax=Phyllobacterium sp. 21LDTY02-6 TaxID=2944903 RepID=UPI0020200247|nr:XRE family transcriptional regulator [Phyllobacterium sp. 21LDTY02-6]MCO4317695.1 helix-turn-helix domain-containing protein [Phyllobacterium sp. 21LDTY02-6]